MKLLVIDDNADTRRLICTVLRKYSEEIIEGATGADAISSYGQHRPDWVLMDIEMQGMDGIAAARAIRKDHPEARIIMVTMHDDPRLRSAAREAGAAGYVLKENLTELPALLLRK